MSLTHADVEEILRLLEGAGAELLIEDGDFRLEVRRSAPAGVMTAEPKAVRPAPAAALAGETAAEATGETVAGTEAAADGSVEVTAPMTGTFYRSPAPQDPPFVNEGDKVEAGAPLCLIEVMKLFTTVEAPTSGTVKSVYAGNAVPVEAGQSLFRILPD